MAAPFEQGIVEPVEEVGYKNRPPLLEDVSIEGPTRTPVPHALDTIEQRELIEDDYDWWRYSKFALPMLVFLLLIFATIFTLTALEQVGSLHNMRDGIPTYFQLQVDSDSDYEGNMHKAIRALRCASTTTCIVAVVLAFLVLFAKPRPTPRKALLFLAALLLVLGAACSWVAFGVSENDSRVAMRCPEMRYFTMEKCEMREGVAVAANALDFGLGLVGVTAFVALVTTIISGDFKLKRVGWRQQERDMETEPIKRNKHDVKAQNVRPVRLALTSLLLLLTLLLAIALVVFIIVLHQDHDTVTLRSARGRTNRSFDVASSEPWEEAGWSARNTRLRYAFSGAAILAILLNLVPWRSRVLAYFFAFVYFAVMVLAVVAFALDVDELRDARDEYRCETTGGVWLWQTPADALSDVALPDRELNCINSPYVATAILELIAAFSVLLYLIMEYVIRYKSVHSGRKYPWFQIRKTEQELDSRRPVRCEITSEVMTAAEYYYRHRFLTEGEMFAASSASSESSASLAYDPAIQQQYYQ